MISRGDREAGAGRLKVKVGLKAALRVAARRRGALRDVVKRGNMAGIASMILASKYARSIGPMLCRVSLSGPGSAWSTISHGFASGTTAE